MGNYFTYEHKNRMMAAFLAYQVILLNFLLHAVKWIFYVSHG